MRYVVQAEFFHTPVDGTLGDLLGDAVGRLKDRSPIKTHVRYPDPTGVVTVHVLATERLLAKKEQAENQLSESQGWRRWWLSKKAMWFSRELRYYKRRAHELALDQLRLMIKLRQDIAIEVARGEKFRLVKRDELHELFESARAASAVWLVVYESTDLLSYESRMVGSTIRC